MAGTHFKGPLLFSSARASLENLKQSMWPDQFTYMDDFYEGAVDTTLRWTIVKDSGASAAIVADATGGEIALTSTATTENDGASIQGKHEIFSLPTTAGDSIWFETRIKTSDADQMDILVGLTETFATNPENALASANIIGFLLADGSAVVSGVTESGGTATTVTFADTTKSTLADDTFVTLGFKATKGTSTDTYWSNNPDQIPDGSKYKPEYVAQVEVEEQPKGDTNAIKNFGLIALSMLLFL